MNSANVNNQNEIECVLISDEDEDDLPPKMSTAKSGHSSNDVKHATDDQSGTYSLEDGDGRRVSRRRKNKNENADDVKNIDQSRAGRSNSNGHDQTNDTYKSNASYSSSNANSDKKYANSEYRTETRSRKRERSPSPVPADIKENDPIPYKEILSGLEGAAFQSR